MEPKNEEEAKEAERKLDRAFDILFNEVNKKHSLFKSVSQTNDTCSA